MTDSRQLAPKGWHIPSWSEWWTLECELEWNGETFEHNTVGGKLKESGTTHWLNPNTDATNESFFTALQEVYDLEIML